MKKYILFYFFILICLLLFFYSNKKDYKYLIYEEAIPIRDYDEIKGMKYTINVDNSVIDNSIDVYSKILSSIYHYKDISNINSFFINLSVDEDYKIDTIDIVDNKNKVIRNINFSNDSNDIVLNLEREDFINYNSNYDIKIRLKRNARKI
ncbi:MAG: hypothetical protein IKF47_00885 [Bacilli bacterium]|nr:hypothetical protein [Bacilli bacterium]